MPGSARSMFLSHVTSAAFLAQQNLSSAESGISSAENTLSSTISSGLSKMGKSNLSGSELLVGAAVATVLVLLAGGGYLIASRMSAEAKLEKNFEEELKHNLVIYFLPDSPNKSSWGMFIEALISEIKGNRSDQANSFLYPFSGIEPSIFTKDNVAGVMYSIQLYSAMAVHFEPFSGDGTLLDSARRRIERLLKSEVPRIRDLIGKSLTGNILHNGDVLVQGTMFFQPERNLDWLRASLFLVNALSNMAINLCEPSDPTTNDVLGLEESFKLCAHLVRIIDFMLFPETGSALSISTLCRADLLTSFLEELKINILELQKGYETKLLHQVNLSQIITGTYAILKKIHLPISKLLYPTKQNSDPERFIQKLDYMFGLITQYPKIGYTLVKVLNRYRPVEHKIPKCKTVTLIDVMDLFSSQKDDSRLYAIKVLRKNKKQMWKIGFADILEYFNKNFIQPLDENPKKQKYFIYWIAFILESYHISIAHRKKTQLQVQAMNDEMMSGLIATEDFYGQWNILTSLKLRKSLQKSLREVLKAQYSLIPVIRSLNLMDELVDKYKNFLLNKSVQLLLKRCIAALNEKAEILLQAMRDMAHAAHSGKDEVSNTQLRYSLAEIIDDKFPHQVLALQEYISEALRVINAPKFIQAEEAEVTLLLKNIVVSARIFSTDEEYQGFVSDICKDAGMLPINVLEQQESSEGNVDSRMSDSSGVVNYFVNDESTESSYSFQLQAFSSIMCGASIGLLVLGLLVILSMTLGAHYIPLIAAMSSATTSIVMISGFMSAAAGGIGLATSYFTSKFFEDAPNPERAGDLTPRNLVEIT